MTVMKIAPLMKMYAAEVGIEPALAHTTGPRRIRLS
jgi:hypothetical protein